MMPRVNRRTVILWLVSLLSLQYIPARQRPADFQLVCPVHGTIPAGQPAQIELPPAFLNASLNAGRDIRLFDRTGSEVPFTILPGVIPGEPARIHPCRLIQFEPGAAADFLLCRLPPTSGEVHAIELITNSRSFRRQVEILAGPGPDRLRPIGQDSIYDFHPMVALRKTRIQFPADAGPFLALKLSLDTAAPAGAASLHLRYQDLDLLLNQPNGTGFTIEGIQAISAGAREERVEWSDMAVEDAAWKVDEKGDSVLLFKTTVPAEEIWIETGTPFFFRSYTMESSRSGRAKSFTRSASGSIHCFPHPAGQDRRTVIGMPPAAGLWFRLVIHNQDNPPLEMKPPRLRWKRLYLFFYGEAARSPYLLATGNSEVPAASYDIRHFVTDKNWFTLPRSRLSLTGLPPAARPVAAAGREPAGIESGTWLTGLIILLAAGMAVWAIRLVRQATPAAPLAREGTAAGEDARRKSSVSHADDQQHND